jgi:exonuclease III
MIKLLSWNIRHRKDAWRQLLDEDCDVALLQEAAEPPADVAGRLGVDPAPWRTAGAGLNRAWRTAVVNVSGLAEVQWLEPKSVECAHQGEFAVSRAGTLAAAVVSLPSGNPIVAASLYASWEKPHVLTGSSWIYADASVHRLVSDLSALFGQQAGHRIIAAGDLNILYGYGDNGSEYWNSRYASVFVRMSALGLSFVGPQAPNGRQADPWPQELPSTSSNVPTYHTNRQSPASATRQLDFVFASSSLADQVNVAAFNGEEEWGPSDHCRVRIELDSG